MSPQLTEIERRKYLDECRRREAMRLGHYAMRAVERLNSASITHDTSECLEAIGWALVGVVEELRNPRIDG